VKLEVAVDASAPRGHLEQMLRRTNDQRGLMGILARDLEDYERDVFATRGFGAWDGLDADTVEQKGSSRVLVDTGGLLRQLTSARIMGETVIVDQGTHFHARFLREGDRGMPRRDPAPRPTRRHVERWADHVLGYIVRGRR
jgi:hypothetical protein